jgi:hypothetical protein
MDSAWATPAKAQATAAAAAFSLFMIHPWISMTTEDAMGAASDDRRGAR